MSSKNNSTNPCLKANHVCDKAQYEEASLWEKLKLNIHLALCPCCRNYTKNNKKLTEVIKSSNVKCMDKTCKEALKAKFDKALKEQEIS
ncbi:MULTISPECIES: hypothetical protein [Aestuariibaculum]|uniref:Zinc-finger domain-containing protein n=1 Tax=Aestuariibaculum lutulentum TaxID=2920935 RepID=A0ABS9RF46_9FLAO|nr:MULTISPECIES: hypothetical protein [Aestuariibaculum]MCH4551558.1 hypothetical protein [Aestuariibaculum lutulentum]MCR8666654.1 hypothetical protein [Aestuariibaculum sp. M13]